VTIARILRGSLRGAMVTLLAALAVAAIVGAVAAGVGYRPVVVLTGSMGSTAPPGALAIAGPTDDVRPGDVLVMRTEGRATITHRVMDVDRDVDGRLVAVTRGDANPDIDPTPYALGERELTVRWVVPHAGRVLTTLRTPAIGLMVIGALVAGAVLWALRRIWEPGDRKPGDRHSDEAVPPPPPPTPRRGRVAPAVGAAVGASLAIGGVAMSLYAGVAAVAGNDFTTLECFDSRLGTVQSGNVTTTTAGSTTVAIAPVDPARSFLLYSASSASGDADDSVVLARLASPTSVELVRSTDGAPPAPIDVEWSVVEYTCGVTVQRGTAVGTGAGSIDVAIQPVDPAASFVTSSSTVAPGTSALGADHLMTVGFVDSDTVRLSSGGTIANGTEHHWQVVTFENDAEIRTQVVGTTMGDGSGSASVTIPSPVDTASTFLITSVASPDIGTDIGDRMVRARLVDATTVEITRQSTAGSVEVSVQVVELRDGSTVQHGVLDLAAGQAVATATTPPVTTARSTAFSTVACRPATAVARPPRRPATWPVKHRCGSGCSTPRRSRSHATARPPTHRSRGRWSPGVARAGPTSSRRSGAAST
jgi:signal peptidase I